MHSFRLLTLATAVATALLGSGLVHADPPSLEVRLALVGAAEAYLWDGDASSPVQSISQVEEGSVVAADPNRGIVWLLHQESVTALDADGALLFQFPFDLAQ